MTELRNIFDAYVITSFKLKADGICGRKFWQRYDQKYKFKSKDSGLKFKNNIAYDEINYLFKSCQLLNKDESDEEKLPDHFIFQLWNIPTNEPVSIRKVMQLALNVGQWKSAVKNTPALRRANEIFTQYNLDSIDSYLESKDIENLSEML